MSMFGLKEVLNDTERLEKFTEKLIELAEKNGSIHILQTE